MYVGAASTRPFSAKERNELKKRGFNIHKKNVAFLLVDITSPLLSNLCVSSFTVEVRTSAADFELKYKVELRDGKANKNLKIAIGYGDIRDIDALIKKTLPRIAKALKAL